MFYTVTQTSVASISFPSHDNLPLQWEGFRSPSFSELCSSCRRRRSMRGWLPDSRLLTKCCWEMMCTVLDQKLPCFPSESIVFYINEPYHGLSVCSKLREINKGKIRKDRDEAWQGQWDLGGVLHATWGPDCTSKGGRKGKNRGEKRLVKTQFGVTGPIRDNG